MGQIIDDVNVLLELSDEELDELLLEDKYNKANLRELVRRTLDLTKEYKRAFEYEQLDNKELREKLEKVKGDLNSW